MNWQDVVRKHNIPVWVGARVCGVGPLSPAGWVVRLDATGGEVFGNGGVVWAAPMSWFRLDLAHPETRAGYLYRLAVRLGCPEGVAAEGVVVDFLGGEWAITIAAGAREMGQSEQRFEWLRRVELDPCDSLLLALVLAWPESK